MIKKILLLLTFVCSIYAETNYEKMYKELSKLDDNALKIYLNDEYYKKGSNFLENDSLKISKKVSGDVHDSAQKSTKSEILVPDYNSALENFYQSALKNKNPLSAYIGNYIIKTYTDKQGVDQLKKFVLFSETLYGQNSKICQAYLDMGEVYENGYLSKKEIKKAWEIYSLGAKDPKCTKGWVASVLASKKFKLEKM